MPFAHAADIPYEPAGEWLSLNVVAVVLSTSALLFGLVVIALEMWLLRQHGTFWDDYSFKLFGLTIIVTAGLFVIPAGYSDEQLAPMMGLLGTALGYILGKDIKATRQEVAPTPPTEPAPNEQA